MALHVDTLTVGPLAVNCYVVGDSDSSEAVLLDPGEEPERILTKVRQGDWKVAEVVLTHAHFDHLLAARAVVEALEASFAVPQGDLEMLRRAPDTVQSWMGVAVDPPPEPDRLLRAGDEVRAGRFVLKVVETPGHSPGGICLITDGAVFVGDTLFAGSIGRTDLPGGDYDLLLEGIRRHLLPLPDETAVYPGHGPATTIGRERHSNPFLAGL